MGFSWGPDPTGPFASITHQVDRLSAPFPLAHSKATCSDVSIQSHSHNCSCLTGIKEKLFKGLLSNVMFCLNQVWGRTVPNRMFWGFCLGFFCVFLFLSFVFARTCQLCLVLWVPQRTVSQTLILEDYGRRIWNMCANKIGTRPTSRGQESLGSSTQAWTC